METCDFYLRQNRFYFKDNSGEQVLVDFERNLSAKTTGELTESFLTLCARFELIEKYTLSSLMHMDLFALVGSLYDYLLCRPLQRIRMLEIGSFFGCSSCVGAMVLENFAKDSLLYCCDTWEGGGGGIENLSSHIDTLSYFRGIARYFGQSRRIIPVAGDSAACAEAWKNGYFDVIFVDGDHRYGAVSKDIVNAVRLLKPGGLLIGHDCECRLKDLPEKIRTKKYGDDELSDGAYHTGVIFALEDLFHDDYNRPVPHSLIWTKMITRHDKEALEDRNQTLADLRGLLGQLVEALRRGNGENAGQREELGVLYHRAQKLAAQGGEALRDIKLLICAAYDTRLEAMETQTNKTEAPQRERAALKSALAALKDLKGGIDCG